LSRVYHNFDPSYTEKVLGVWSYNRGMFLAAALLAAGILVDSQLVFAWIRAGLHGLAGFSFSAVFGLWLVIMGFETFSFTLILHMVGTTDRGDRGTTS
jgi:hypothetical protein